MTYYILRGGSWFNGPRYCRAAYRLSDYYPTNVVISIGLRLVLPQ